MKGKLTKISSIIIVMAMAVTMLFPTTPQVKAEENMVAIYRLYNPDNGEHLYTTDTNETSVLYHDYNWGYEGIAWYAPERSATPVYRLYNPVLCNHLYTTDLNEVNVLTTTTEWVKDNNGQPVFYSDGTIPIYRVYNRELQGMHHLTTDKNEYDTLPVYGWAQEGTSLYALKTGSPIITMYWNQGGSELVFECNHSWKEATCTEAKTCTRCGATEGSAKGHNFQWVTTKEAAVGVAGLKEHKCTTCGYVDGTETIPALADIGQETPWVYTDGTHRTKTMYDGTVINEELVTCGNYSAWGYFDDGAASAMNDAVNYMLVNVNGWNPFNVSSAYYDNARKNAFAYAIKGSSSKAYHANFGGLPIIEEDKKYITLMDGNNQDNYIGCFVRDAYQENGDFTYGQYWHSCFGTYYASGSF